MLSRVYGWLIRLLPADLRDRYGAEMHELFDQLFATELPYHDVHGRPTVVRLSAGELARKFGRS